MELNLNTALKIKLLLKFPQAFVIFSSCCVFLVSCYDK